MYAAIEAFVSIFGAFIDLLLTMITRRIKSDSDLSIDNNVNNLRKR